ncbi:putative bacteriophage protein gp46 [Yersinia pseudotuberculosis IP 32953]|uniref:Putative Bacteriophage protein gp46 n=2 Tax=Yersinia pseudotuberculosis TaxID=633 RepID=Q66BB0_YERPS|nr:hypothetical protein [Yersinia pseudotuberculosis]CQD58936.1 bacteriophage protein gp46 [Yersinia intermedia]AJJ01834.1 putative bacteriophage protein gp46 [Yersinia pseudotuberculosis]AJJ56809.1 putative bacteriophage protein gp46 [Yersinia pseudotuberculosis IP 32953]AYX14527.1 hypothetical protein EGX44_04675 [Yersinia pseudotuberculosis]MBO1563427.1 hypothetical protein [Yersinia pseudotuberculosis]
MTTASERKRAQRLRDKKLGITELTLRIDTAEMAMLLDGCEQRRIARGPYERAEYLIGLLRQDNKLLHKQLAELKKDSCKRCGDTLPGDRDGCCFQGDTACWQTLGYKKLMLDTL